MTFFADAPRPHTIEALARIAELIRREKVGGVEIASYTAAKGSDACRFMPSITTQN